MARARLLKPGFFVNEDLLELPPLVRILFAGLWCIADREGRLEDRPKRIKIELIPGDDMDVDAALSALAEKGFITRYECGGKRYLQIVSFAKHQRPHIKEAASTIPEPDEHQPRTVLAPTKAIASPAEALTRSLIQKPYTEAKAEKSTARRQKPGEVLQDEALMAELRERFPKVDLVWESEKWLDWCASKPPKSPRLSWRNWVQRASEGSGQQSNVPPELYRQDDDLDWLARRYREGKERLNANA